MEIDNNGTFTEDMALYQSIRSYIERILTDDDTYEKEYVEKIRKLRAERLAKEMYVFHFVGGVILDDRLKHIDESFSDMLLRKIQEKGMTDSQCYNKAGITKQNFSKAKKPNYHPKKETAIAYALALELDLEETQELLYKAGYVLTHSSKFDIIIEYCIESKIYNLQKVNETLHSFEQSVLGTKE